MAYKDMKKSLYLAVTLGLFAIEVAGSIFITNITTVFNFASALGVTCLAFWFPAGYYLMAAMRFKPEGKGYVVTSRLFMVLGVVNFIVGLAAAIIDLI
jgi:hypothetical protein